MKKRFVSIFLAICIVVSMCVIAISSVSAAASSDEPLGITNHTLTLGAKDGSYKDEFTWNIKEHRNYAPQYYDDDRTNQTCSISGDYIFGQYQGKSYGSSVDAQSKDSVAVFKAGRQDIASVNKLSCYGVNPGKAVYKNNTDASAGVTSNYYTDSYTVTVKPAPSYIQFKQKKLTMYPGQTVNVGFYLPNGTAAHSIFCSYTNSKTTSANMAKQSDTTGIVKLKANALGNNKITLRTYNNKADTLSVDVRILPPMVSVANTSSGLKATWGKVAGAQKYIVYYKEKSAKNWSSTKATDTSFIVPNAESGELYYVQVQAMGINGIMGEYSKVKSMTCLSRTAIQKAEFTSNNQTNLKLKAVTGANKYQIARLKDGEKNYTYLNTTTTDFVDSTATAGAVYYYQARAAYETENNGTAYSAWSGVARVVTMAKPVVQLTNKSNGIRAEWNAVKGAQKYIVYYKTSTDTGWTGKVETKNTYYPILNTVSGKIYYVQVIPYGTNNLKGLYSNVASIKYLTAPVYGISYTDDGEKFDVHWNKVEGANGYEAVFFYEGQKFDAYSGKNTSFVQQGDDGKSSIAPGGPYYYQVRAVFKTANGHTTYSAWSTYVPVYFKPASYEKSIKEAEQKVYAYFTSHGLNAAATCGIMGNIKQECLFDSQWYFNEIESNIGDGFGNSGGIAMWYGPNFERFKRDCLNWKTSLDAQIEYLYQTLIKNDSGALPESQKYSFVCAGCWTKLKSVPNTKSGAAEAAKIFSKLYERPSNASETTRASYAQNYWDMYAK